MRVANYSIKTSNYNKRRPVTLKKVADFLLASILVINPVMLTMPDFNGKAWVLFGWNMLAALFKLFTKMISDDNIYEGN